RAPADSDEETGATSASRPLRVTVGWTAEQRTRDEKLRQGGPAAGVAGEPPGDGRGGQSAEEPRCARGGRRPPAPVGAARGGERRLSCGTLRATACTTGLPAGPPGSRPLTADGAVAAPLLHDKEDHKLLHHTGAEKSTAKCAPRPPEAKIPAGHGTPFAEKGVRGHAVGAGTLRDGRGKGRRSRFRLRRTVTSPSPWRRRPPASA